MVVLYRPNSEHSSAVEQYAREFQRRTGRALELMNVDNKEAIRLVELYDAVRYPAILAIGNDGHLLNMWLGDQLPLIDTVNGYLVEQ